ncbi:MAG: type II secretion system protein M [Agathobacter sp.]|nr:type II secretion system protein M [Agathobacter sp.]
MKKQLTTREKILMLVLVILMVVCAYYYAFYVPITQQVASLVSQAATIDEQILLVDAQVARMNEMKAELDAIAAGEMGNVKELPAYDNSGNVMHSLSAILQNAMQYNVNFSSVEEEESTVRRHISLSYDCSSYETAKSILTQIYESDYRSLIKDVSITVNEGYHVVVDLTYYEYK